MWPIWRSWSKCQQRVPATSVTLPTSSRATTTSTSPPSAAGRSLSARAVETTRRTLQIDIQDAVPLLLGRVFRALIGVERLYANVIDEHVDAAEMVDCLLDHALTFARF